MSYAKVYRTSTRLNTLKTVDLVKAYESIKGKKRNVYTREYNRRVKNGAIKVAPVKVSEETTL